MDDAGGLEVVAGVGVEVAVPAEDERLGDALLGGCKSAEVNDLDDALAQLDDALAQAALGVTDEAAAAVGQVVDEADAASL